MFDEYSRDPSRLGDKPMPPRPLYRALKRFFDVAMSCVGLLLLSPVILLVCLLVRLDSPGPALFRQERLGKDSIPFMMYKFRSMRSDAEDDGPQQTQPNDLRVTRMGRILRRTHFDEVPQFWNVIRGDMSLVGPRPERAVFYDLFEQHIPTFRQRLLVAPGITGLAQVSGGYELDPSVKIRYDLAYIQNQSLMLDVRIMVRTLAVLITGEGSR